ncbi:MAG: Holliday junction branch migration protein RuvA [Synergistaceae bacterium]|jgi:Holliday junction DNA helicase RuvA|nr:Holliday junction branch migration protein RuvA [Synergistaceae bacterium]
MIRSLYGIVISISGDAICLDVSGFGLEIFASGSLLASARAGDFLRCSAYMQVSDSGITLYGFSDETERALFLEITQVKTMGGKLSIAILRHLDAETILRSITSQDTARLAVPGVGTKRAERICFELKSKVEKKFGALLKSDIHGLGLGSIDGEVISGLVGLGFSQSEAARAVAQCRSESEDRGLSEEELMMSALGRLQRI